MKKVQKGEEVEVYGRLYKALEDAHNQQVSPSSCTVPGWGLVHGFYAMSDTGVRRFIASFEVKGKPPKAAGFVSLLGGDVQLAVSGRHIGADCHKYRVWQSSIDDMGRYTYCGTSSLEVARAFAAKWVGATPTLGTGYAVCDWGVSKVEAEGLTLAELFPALGGE